MNSNRKSSARGFTLVELSIVIVMIGLLVGGIIGGHSLIKASQLRSSISEILKYADAFNQFANEFSAYPGDMSNAQTYFPSVTGNGDGDRNIENPAADCVECYYVWQHLASAELIEGSYSGATLNVGGIGNTGGTNTPASRNTGSTYLIYSLQSSANANFFAGYYDVVLVFGANNAAQTNQYIPSPFYTPADMYNMDKKIDDSLPQTGNMRTFISTATPTDCYNLTAYRLDVVTPTCSGMYGITPIR